MAITEQTLVSGDLQAKFLPARGMLGVSLRHRGEELLRRLDNLDAAAVKGSTAGIPLLYPWANRVDAPRYSACGKEVVLDPASPLLHPDEHGLLIHGIKWALLPWEVVEAVPDRLLARLCWNRPEWLAVFPFRHQVEMTASLRPDSLTIETTVTAEELCPISFGFHPYFGIPNSPRSEWHLELPAMRKIVVDDRGIPTGAEEPSARFNAPLGESNFDAGFAVLNERPSFALAGASRRITVEFLEGYRCAQVFAPKGRDFVALEPMTAPTNALATGRGLQFAEPGKPFRASFRIGVQG